MLKQLEIMRERCENVTAAMDAQKHLIAQLENDLRQRSSQAVLDSPHETNTEERGIDSLLSDDATLGAQQTRWQEAAQMHDVCPPVPCPSCFRCHLKSNRKQGIYPSGASLLAPNWQSKRIINRPCCDTSVVVCACTKFGWLIDRFCNGCVQMCRGP